MLSSKSKVYNPQISFNSYQIIKRLSWLHGKPMTKTLDIIIKQAFEQVSPESICIACEGRGSDCTSCPVNQK
ncbi:hypothetical protein EW093_17165 (plasmid) [Thiospirochaeta perfilievii]|uniref:Uncharacterized protein n=1 Tax=Thiospirochaeta perfilievii TaxID=252967 RepID=A0A5C1QGF2_9SPIO|nr:hypothetical protein [Thiospirochaeta perfilievii]QEN06438.1 hypothetical protein EW093_17165 [Thiospirochaeta perfilievii]